MKKQKSLVFSLLCAGLFLFFVSSCEKENEDYKLPTLTTSEIFQVTLTTAEARVEITDDVGSIIMARGVVWGLNPNPSLNDNKTSDGEGSGSFTTRISGLQPFEKYYFRSYATNIAGTAYGPEKEFSTSRLTQIIIGDTTDMIVREYNVLVKDAYNQPYYHYFDIDNNPPYDIGFMSEKWGSNGFGYHPHSVIYSLEDYAQLYGYYTTDTIFKNTEIFYTNINNLIIQNVTITFSSNRMSENDSIKNIYQNRFKLTPLNKGDKIKSSDTYKSCNITLNDDSYQIKSVFAGMDPTINSKCVYLNDCYQFPQGEEKYIGLQLKDSRLGWIKILITDINKILVIESGIQR